MACSECFQRYGHNACCSEYHRGIALLNDIVSDFVATALQDAQLREADEACSEDREARDTGTIYTLRRETFDKLRNIVKRFEDEMPQSIEAALELEPKGEGYEYAKQPLTRSRIGSTLWLAVTGSGVTFTDDGCAVSLVAMAEWARANHSEGLYLGDDGELYLF